MTNDQNNADDQPGYDLEERTAQFGEAIIDFVRPIKLDAVTDPLVRQIVRSSTSIGANYCEANDAETRKAFRYKINTCRKESKETKLWLRMLARAVPERRHQAVCLWQEAKELTLIFAKFGETLTLTNELHH